MESRNNKGEGSLQDFVREVNGESHLRVEHDFGDGFVRLRTSEADRRQAAQDIQCSENIVLELLRNARDARATHIFMAYSKEGDHRLVTMLDDGDGIPAAMHAHVFEPRVTSKLDTSHMDAWGLHGRGMALFSIKENAEEARVAESSPGKGCSITVRTDLRKLGEKADQSSFPRFELAEDGTVNVRGPRNIVRTACEFAIQSRNTCAVHVGSPAEIASTLYTHGMSTLSAIDRVFCRDLGDIPVVRRLATASDPDDLARIAAGLGLAISTRTARRIIDGQLPDAAPLLELIVIERPRKSSGGRARAASPKGRRLRLQKDDALRFGHDVKSSFAQLAERYYLEEAVEPTVKVSGNRLVITIPLMEKD